MLEHMPMTKIVEEETLPCTKPYQLKLDDCLACSSCVTTSEKDKLTKRVNIEALNESFIFIMSPHSKINVYTVFQRMTQISSYQIFEDYLLIFLHSKNRSFVFDTSLVYDVLYRKAFEIIKEKPLITSSCPATVTYIERTAIDLVGNLLPLKSPHQISASFFSQAKCVAVVPCFDKKLENDGYFTHVIGTSEFIEFLEKSGFMNFCDENHEQKSIYNSLLSEITKEFVTIFDFGQHKPNSVLDEDKNLKNKRMYQMLPCDLGHTDDFSQNQAMNLVSSFKATPDTFFENTTMIKKNLDYNINEIGYKKMENECKNLEILHSPQQNTHYGENEKLNSSDLFLENSQKPVSMYHEVNHIFAKNMNEFYFYQPNDSEQLELFPHRSVEIDEDYIGYFFKNICSSNFNVDILKKDFFQYTYKEHDQEKVLYRIFGLENAINFLNKARKNLNFVFAEVFICRSSCINGPTQLSEFLTKNLEVSRSFQVKKQMFLPINNIETIKRSFKSIRREKKRFKIEW